MSKRLSIAPSRETTAKQAGYQRRVDGNLSFYMIYVSEGSLLRPKETPQAPRKAPEGDFPARPPLDSPSSAKGQGLRPLPFGNPPRLFWPRLWAERAHFVALFRLVTCPRPRYEVRGRDHPTGVRTAWGGFQGEGARRPPPLVVERGSPEGERVETLSLWAFFPAAFFAKKAAPRRDSGRESPKSKDSPVLPTK